MDKSSAESIAWFYRRTPQWYIRKAALHNFRLTVRHAARHVPFYRKAFKDRGIDAGRVEAPADLGDFFTTPDDVVKAPTAFISERAADKPGIVFESSGTSGKNKQVYYSRREMEKMGAVMAAGMRLMGIGPEDRVANGFDFSIWIPGMLAHYGLMAAGNFCLAFGKVDPIEVYRRLEQYRFTAILGEPTWLIRLTELAEKHGRYPIKVLLGGAEEMPADAIPWMEKVWSVGDVKARVKMGYGSVELGSALGFQPCETPDHYHVDTTDFLPELIDVDGEGYGELVFTTLRRRTMPLVRYRTRDVTTFPAEPCPCGLLAPRMAKLRGRRDELIVASGGNLYPLMFESILGEVAGITHDWQVVFRLEGVREILELNVESARLDVDPLRAEIQRQATLQYPDLMKNLALGIFQMRILVHAPTTLRTARKLKRMVDVRHFGGNGARETAGEPEVEAAAVPAGGEAGVGR